MKQVLVCCSAGEHMHEKLGRVFKEVSRWSMPHAAYIVPGGPVKEVYGVVWKHDESCRQGRDT